MATVRNIKLEDITLEYNAFVESQVLTHTQLNGIIDFFEDQQRLTRTCLVGVGLVCGLGIRGDEKGIKVSKGCAVTTDGDLLYVPDTTFKDFKAYNNQQILYPPFYPLGTDQPQMALWELVLPDAKTKELPVGSQPLAQFAAATGGQALDQVVALLYLEYYEREPDACTAIDCNNQGKKQVARPKVLLLAPADMDQLINRTTDEMVADDLFKNYFNAYTGYFTIPVIYPRRALLNAGNVKTSSNLAAAYTTVVQTDYLALAGGIEKLYQTFRFVLDKNAYWNIGFLKGRLNNIFTKAIAPTQAQYLYDFYKDLVTGYNELRELLSNIVYQCCPDVYAFPKHIMLGFLNGPAGPQPPAYRHQFYPSPAISKNKVTLNVARAMMERLFGMITQFSVPEPGNPVRVTPSADYDRQLEERAIPFYYNNVPALTQKWDYGRSLRGTDKQILSYHGAAYANGNDAVANPLRYSIDAYNFFRIEGHIGRGYKEGLQALNNLRQTYNLPFEIVALRLGEVAPDSINPEDYRCQFEDLEAVIRAWKAEQDCLYAAAARFFSGFRTDSPQPSHLNFGILDTTLFRPDAFTFREPSPVTNPIPADENTHATRGFISGSPNKLISGLAGARLGTSFIRTNPINENLLDQNGLLGNQLAAVTQERFVSAADFARKALAGLGNIKLTDDEDRLITITYPVELIARAKAITQVMPATLGDLDAEVVNNYQDRIKSLCEKVDEVKKRTNSIFKRAGYSRKGYEEEYQLVLWQLSENCCSAKSLQVLLEEIQNRKRKILDNLSFARYASQHPGLEHKAGVPRGGTFVVVYAGPERNAPPGIRNLVPDLPEVINAISAGEPRRYMPGTFARDEDLINYLGTRFPLENIDLELDRYLADTQLDISKTGLKAIRNKAFEVAKNRLIREEFQNAATVPNDLIVADFCLPYLCCSDCPPVAFIMPAPKVELAIEKPVACDNEATLNFTRVVPADGEIKAPPGLEKTLEKEEGVTVFNPKKVTAAWLGKPISFTLNDQVTDCQIIVHKHPVVKVTVTIIRETDQVLVVDFTGTSNQKEPEVFNYTWNLGDGRPAQHTTLPELKGITYQKEDLKKLDIAGEFTVMLLATNQQCTAEFPVKVTYQVPDETVELALATDKACVNEGLIPFTKVKPETGEVFSPSNPNAVFRHGAQWVLDTTKISSGFGQPVKDFMVGEKPAPDCNITIFEHPAPRFTLEQKFNPDNQEVTVILDNNTPHPAIFAFTWDFGDGATTTEENPTHAYPVADFPNGRQVVISLRATNKEFEKCTDVFAAAVSLKVDRPTLCQDLVADTFKAGFTALEVLSSNFEPYQRGLDNTRDLIKRLLRELDAVIRGDNNQAVIKEITALTRLLLQNMQQSGRVLPELGILLRKLIIMGLGVIRCQERFSADASQEQWMAWLNEIIENAGLIQRFTNTLNDGNELKEFLADFMAGFVSQEGNILALVQKLINRIR